MIAFDRLLAGESALADALGQCVAVGAAAIAVLPEESCAALSAAADRLTWRPARPVVGEGARQVLQDFDLTLEFPQHSPYRDIAARIGAALAAGADRLRPNPLPAGFHINDLILQRYACGSRGITPHRDHLRYRGLVALLILAGNGRFCLCEDRRGTAAREIDAGPGDLLLMRAPGLAESPTRPFHFLDRITARRLSLGLRWDTAGAPGAAQLSDAGQSTERTP